MLATVQVVVVAWVLEGIIVIIRAATFDGIQESSPKELFGARGGSARIDSGPVQVVRERPFSLPGARMYVYP